VTRGSLTVRSVPGQQPFQIEVTPRIGIRQCADWPLRFTIEGNPFVSRSLNCGRLLACGGLSGRPRAKRLLPPAIWRIIIDKWRM